jgi:hypothetical protein
MNISLSQCYVTVHDPDEALMFYRDTLGLHVRSDVVSDGFRRVTLSPPAQPDIQIVLNPTHADREADGDTVLALLPEAPSTGWVSPPTTWTRRSSRSRPPAPRCCRNRSTGQRA